MRFDRIVVGGGFSGLLAARKALRDGETVALIEQSETWGGMVNRVDVGGYAFDSGAEAFSIVGDDVLELITELGLAAEIVYPEKHSPKIVTASGSFSIPSGVMGIPSRWESLEGLPKMTKEVIARAKLLDSAPLEPGFEDLSVADLVTKRLGPEVLGTLVEPLCLGVHSCSAQDIEARAIFPQLLRVIREVGSLVGAVAKIRGGLPSPGSAVATLRGGLHHLVSHLVSDLTEHGVLMLNKTSVSSVFRDGHQWEVATPGGSFVAPELSLCVGPKEAAKLLENEPDLAGDVGAVTAVDQALTLMIVEAPELNAYPLGSGALISNDCGIEAKAVTHLNAKWGWWHDRLPVNHHALRFSFGRGGVVPHKPFDGLVNEAMKNLFGVDSPRKIASMDVVWRGGVIKPSVGHADRVARLTGAASARGLELCGSYISGNGLLGITRSLRGEAHVTTH